MRTFSPGFLEEIANHPAIRPTLGGEGPVELAAAMANPSNYCFTNEEGGFVGLQLQSGGTVIECHTIFKVGSRPRGVIEFMLQCQEYLFTRTYCTEIVTKVPDDNKGAHHLAHIGGFQEIFRRENGWKDGVGVSYRSLTLDRWLKACSTAREAGKAFHSLLEDAKRAKGSTLPVHVDEEIHDRWVGAAMLMAMRGNVAKGINLYNSWAVFAGYRPAKLVSELPVVVDVGDAVVGERDGKMEVLLCR